MYGFNVFNTSLGFSHWGFSQLELSQLGNGRKRFRHVLIWDMALRDSVSAQKAIAALKQFRCKIQENYYGYLKITIKMGACLILKS
jgi:hypothetical protein